MFYATTNFAKSLRLVGDAVGLGIVKVQQLSGEGNVWLLHLLAALGPLALQGGHGVKLFTGDFAA